MKAPDWSHVRMWTWRLVCDTCMAQTYRMSSGAMTPRDSTYLGHAARTARSHCCLVRRPRRSASSFLTLMTLVMTAEEVASSSRCTLMRSGMPLASKSAWPALRSATEPGAEPDVAELGHEGVLALHAKVVLGFQFHGSRAVGDVEQTGRPDGGVGRRAREGDPVVDDDRRARSRRARLRLEVGDAGLDLPADAGVVRP